MSKKTETIEVRVSPELKARLGDACRKTDQSMSVLIRRLIDSELSGRASSSMHSGRKFRVSPRIRSLRQFGVNGVSLLALAAAWVIATQSPVTAQMEARVTFAEMDRNNDGTITKEEYRRFLEGDVIDEVELPAVCEADFAGEGEGGVGEMAAVEFASFDANANGELSFDEVRMALRKDRAEEFTSFDRDSNGFLTPTEFAAGMADLLADEEDISRECRQALQAQFPDDGSWEDQDWARLEFAAIDADRDKQISREEYLEN